MFLSDSNSASNVPSHDVFLSDTTIFVESVDNFDSLPGVLDTLRILLLGWAHADHVMDFVNLPDTLAGVNNLLIDQDWSFAGLLVAFTSYNLLTVTNYSLSVFDSLLATLLSFIV